MKLRKVETSQKLNICELTSDTEIQEKSKKSEVWTIFTSSTRRRSSDHQSTKR